MLRRLRLLPLLTVLTALSCTSARLAIEADMIVPNEHSVSRGSRGMLADADECRAAAGREKRRLADELYAFDPNIQEDEARHARNKAAGAAIGAAWAKPNDVRQRSRSGKTDKERRGAIAGAIATDIALGLLSGGDDTPIDVQRLDHDINSLDTFIRLTNVCLRQQGYRVDEFAEDGTGTPNLEPYDLRVTLREKDCTGTVMYQQPKPEEGLGGPAPASDWCTPAPVELASVSAAPASAAGFLSGAVAPVTVMPPSDLPDDLARIETRSELDGYLEVEPECVDSRSGFQFCSWRLIGKGQKSWKQLAKKANTRRRVNVVCEVPREGTFRTPDTCEIFPRETLGKPDMDDDARDTARARIGKLNGIAETSRLVGDGPADCDSLGDASQQCRWITNNQAQGYNLVGTAAQTRKAADLTCRFSQVSGATVPGSCEASQSN